MTMGKNSRKSSVRSSIRAPKFLDKSGGFYGRLDEPDVPAAEEEDMSGLKQDLKQETSTGEDVEMFNEDDGETLLRRKPSRQSSRWKRSLRRKREERREEVTEVIIEVQLQEDAHVEHFPIPQEADDQVLIRDKKRVRALDQDEEEESRAVREQEEGRKALKRNSKNYRKALDRVFRRGWEAFITNLHSVTLTPVSSPSPSPSSPSAKKRQHSSVLAELH